jgi:hypothetical protein
MGKTRMVPLVIEEWCRISRRARSMHWRYIGEWQSKELGKPSGTALKRWREGFVASTRKGGCNEHLGPYTTGNLRIRRQKDGAILATYTASLFEVV